MKGSVNGFSMGSDPAQAFYTAALGSATPNNFNIVWLANPSTIFANIVSTVENIATTITNGGDSRSTVSINYFGVWIEFEVSTRADNILGDLALVLMFLPSITMWYSQAQPQANHEREGFYAGIVGRSMRLRERVDYAWKRLRCGGLLVSMVEWHEMGSDVV